MESYVDYDLCQVSTMRTHSIARSFYVPESKEELISLIRSLRSKNSAYFVVSGGSNVVFASVVKTPIISLRRIDDSVSTKDGITTVGGSARIQKLISHLKSVGKGGIEYLFSLPACVGGCIYMNAGRGRPYSLAISDYLESVSVYSPSEDKIKNLRVSKDEFGYRTSPFQGSDLIILSATFCFPDQDPEITQCLIDERLMLSKKYLSSDKPSCGSVYRIHNRVISYMMKGLCVGDACFSKKTSNWISNLGDASGDDVIKLIKKGIKIHKFALQKCVEEIIIVK